MITLISFTVVLGILIFVHEFGHFIVAKITGVGVEKFSLGFPPKLIGFKKGETQYMISAIPLGGYVKLKGENPDEPLTNDPKEFGSRSVGVRFAIVSAGPIMNFLLAFVLMPLVYFIGINVPAYLEKEPVVGWIAEDSPAMIAGLQAGDHVLSVDGEEVTNWEMFNEHTQLKQGRNIKIKFLRNGNIHEKIVAVNSDNLSVAWIGAFPEMDAQVGEIHADLPAQEAGLEKGDLIKEIGDTNITHWIQMSKVIRKYPGDEMPFTIKREGELLKLRIKPAFNIDKFEENSQAELAGLKVGDTILTINNKDVSFWKEALLNRSFPQEEKLTFEVLRDSKQHTITVIPDEIKDIGIRVGGKIGIGPLMIFKKYGVLASLWEGFKETIEITGKIFRALGKLFTFQLSLKTIGGPITIARVTGSMAQLGLSSLLIFTAFLTINLAIINIFPIPMLDGGHLFFMLIELVMRKPLEAKKMEIAQKIGIVLLILLFLTVTYNDIMRVVPKKYLEFLPWK